MVVDNVGSSRVSPSLRMLDLVRKHFPVIPFMSWLRSVQRSAENARLENLESVRIENACVAADLGVQSSVVCRDFTKAGGKRPMPGECAAITAGEADEYVDVVGSSKPVHSDMGSEGFTFKESMSHAFPKDLGGFLTLLAFPCCLSFINLIFTLL